MWVYSVPVIVNRTNFRDSMTNSTVRKQKWFLRLSPTQCFMPLVKVLYYVRESDVTLL